jgi:hypothetical protein
VTSRSLFAEFQIPPLMVYHYNYNIYVADAIFSAVSIVNSIFLNSSGFYVYLESININIFISLIYIKKISLHFLLC